MTLFMKSEFPSTYRIPGYATLAIHRERFLYKFLMITAVDSIQYIDMVDDTILI